MRNIKEVRWIESTLWRVGEREHTNLDLSSHQRPKARQSGLSLGLVFVTAVLGRWLIAFAGVVFAVVTFGGGCRVFSSSFSSKYFSAAAPDPPFVTVRAARVPGLQPTPPSAIAKEEAVTTVGLRLPS
jgi:hypothetical protein